MGEAPNNMNTVVTFDAQKRVVAFDYEDEKKEVGSIAKPLNK